MDLKWCPKLEVVYMTSIIHVWQRRSWLLPSTSGSRRRHSAPGQDVIPLQRLHVCAHSRDPHPAIKLWCQVPFTISKTIFQIEMYCMQWFWKSNISKVELSMIKICELLRKLWSLGSCFLILPPGALTPQGIEGAMKRDLSKHWCTFQWCASRGWFIAHDNWTSWEEVPYCFSRSITRFHGHAGGKIDVWIQFEISRPVAAIKSLRFALFPTWAIAAENLLGKMLLKQRGFTACVKKPIPYLIICSR